PSILVRYYCLSSTFPGTDFRSSPFIITMDLFFSSHGDLRVRHAFPTRRSSDLPLSSSTLPVSVSPLRISNRAPGFVMSRSPVTITQEHASEAQERRINLCRPLFTKNTPLSIPPFITQEPIIASSVSVLLTRSSA